MKLYKIETNITCIAPILSAANGAIALGMDTCMQRDSAGRPALPGSLVRGNLKQAWHTFLQHTNNEVKPNVPLDDWLGSGSDESDFQPRRARLIFGYWWSDLTWDPANDQRPLYRIRIDSDTGAAVKGALQTIESPYVHGQEVTFSGQIHAWLNDEVELDRLCRWLRKGIIYSRMLGANKGLGFGRVKAVDVVATAVTATAGGVADDILSEHLGLRILSHDPFCIGKPAVGENNRFDTEDHIPGAAILGALKRAMTLSGDANWPMLSKHFDDIRISHAMPAEAGTRTRSLAPPLSVSTFTDSQGRTSLLDLVDCAKPGWIKRYQNNSAPCFQPDWKGADWDLANRELQRPTIEKRLDIHTAINSETGAALTGQLYSMEAVVPGELTWLANVDFGQIEPAEERAQVREEFLSLSALGLNGVGKLKTRMTASPEPWFDFTFSQRDLVSQPLRNNETIRLVLQTPALLLSPGLAPPASGGQDELERAYRDAWDWLSSESLELVHFFTRDELRGGLYWFARFRTLAQRKHYHPLIHTLPGSLFVLRVVDTPQATALLQEWQRYGLPQTPYAPGGNDWSQNPWIRNNGYGEIAIDPAIPFEKLPEDQWNEC